ncbi:MAG: acyloxyacyl hydrolase, partial [Thermodesulfobacteriota bacterium]|nr:acyloxyacyl hydrolase [Thermodesulfobacteriota bacterium]
SQPMTMLETFTKDRKYLQVISGSLFSPFALAARTDVMNYAQTNVRLGWMLNSPPPSKSFLRGNVEAIFELSNSIIYKGSGNYIGGFSTLFRYNFIQPDGKLIPYIQAGAGVVYTDAYKDRSQTAIGQAIEFTPQASLGLHYLIRTNWSIEAEAMFHHISNADLDERNHGINAFGGFMGLTYYFDMPLK